MSADVFESRRPVARRAGDLACRSSAKDTAWAVTIRVEGWTFTSDCANQAEAIKVVQAIAAAHARAYGTPSKKLRVLREIYASIPEVHCKGLCVESCSTVPVSGVELAVLERATGRAIKKTESPFGFTMRGDFAAPCKLLVLGRCVVYEQRPVICRVFGATAGSGIPTAASPIGC